jgi:hypothetical protein
MATVLYLVVISKDGPKDTSTEIRTAPRPDEVINLAYSVSKDEKDPRRIDKIMKVDVEGDVTFYEIVFDGRLHLREIPMETHTLTDSWTGESMTTRQPTLYADGAQYTPAQQGGF